MKSCDVPWHHFRQISLEDWSGFRTREPTRNPPPGCAWVLSPLGSPVEVRDCRQAELANLLHVGRMASYTRNDQKGS